MPKESENLVEKGLGWPGEKSGFMIQDLTKVQKGRTSDVSPLPMILPD